MGKSTIKSNQPVAVATDPSLPTVQLPVAAIPAKPIWESLTFYVNAFTLLALALQQFSDLKVVTFFVTDPRQAEGISQSLLDVLAVVNILLRVFKTKEPLTFGDR